MCAQYLRVVALVQVVLINTITPSTLANETNRLGIEFENVIVRAQHTVELSSEFAGTIDAVTVRLNDEIESGSPLVQFSSEQVDLSVAQAEEEFKRSEVMLERSKAVVLQSKVTAQRRADDLDRYSKLAQSSSDGERRRLEEVKELADIEHVVSYNDFLQSKQLCEVGRVRLEVARLQQSKMTVRAPFDGVITRLHADAGKYIQIGSPICELRAMNVMLAEVPIEESAIDPSTLMNAPVEVRFQVASQERALSGQVVSFDSEVNARGQVKAVVQILNQRENGRWLLLHGKDVSLRISRAESNDIMPLAQEFATIEVHE